MGVWVCLVQVYSLLMLFSPVHMCSSDGVMVYIYHICLDGYCRYNYFQVQKDAASIQVSPLKGCGVYLCKYGIGLLCGACFDSFCIFLVLCCYISFASQLMWLSLLHCVHVYVHAVSYYCKFLPVNLTVGTTCI